MSRVGPAFLSAIVCLAAFASFAYADGASNSQWSGDLYLTGSKVDFPIDPSATLAVPVVGVGGRLAYRPSGGGFGYAANVEYGVGDSKVKITPMGGTEDTYETKANSVIVNLALLHYYDCCDFECGPDLYYENTTFKLESTGNPEEKLSGMSTFGIGGQFGGSFPLNDSVRLFGEDRQILGYTTWNQTVSGDKIKLNRLALRNSWRGGFRFQF